VARELREEWEYSGKTRKIACHPYDCLRMASDRGSGKKTCGTPSAVPKME